MLPDSDLAHLPFRQAGCEDSTREGLKKKLEQHDSTPKSGKPGHQLHLENVVCSFGLLPLAIQARLWLDSEILKMIYMAKRYEICSDGL